MAVTGEHPQGAPPPRVVRLVLVDEAGVALGSLPPFPVDVPWWPDAEAVVAGARKRDGLDVVALRLLGAGLPAPPGGGRTHVGEVRGDVPAPLTLEPWARTLHDHPLRQAWARPGGPD